MGPGAAVQDRGSGIWISTMTRTGSPDRWFFSIVVIIILVVFMITTIFIIIIITILVISR
jgi:hypothetical protein